MVKWQATLSTTGTIQLCVGIINVRARNKNTEVLQVNIVENALPLDLSLCKVF